MVNIPTDDLAFELCDEARNALNVVKDKFPAIRELDKTPERLMSLQGENADIIGALFKDSIGQAEYICRNGRAIKQCAQEIARIDKNVGLALLVGGAAICIGGYVLYKMNQQRDEIELLKHRITVLEHR